MEEEGRGRVEDPDEENEHVQSEGARSRAPVRLTSMPTPYFFAQPAQTVAAARAAAALRKKLQRSAKAAPPMEKSTVKPFFVSARTCCS